MLHNRHYTPGSFVGTVRRELDEAFNRAFGETNGQSAPSTHYVPLTIWEDDGHVHLQADVPGFDRESLDVMFRDGQLWIRGERKVPREDGKYWHNERMFGQIERAVSMPDTIDCESIEAELDAGVLYVTLAKKPEAQPTKISIKEAGGNKKRLTEANSS